MYSVIGTKMQEKPQNKATFVNGTYSLVGPKGPITPSEWDKKVFPGCTIEIKRDPIIAYTPQKPQMSPWANDRTSSRSESSVITVIPRPSTPKSVSGSKKPEVRQLENVPAEAHINRQSLSSETGDSSIDGQNYPASVDVVVAGQSSDPTLTKNGHLSSNIDNTVQLTEELESNSNVYLRIEDQENVHQQPRRKNTDMQSFVEDASETEGEDYFSIAIRGPNRSLYPTEHVGTESSYKEPPIAEIELESPFSTSTSQQGKGQRVNPKEKGSSDLMG
jgi:hypothetical protein